MKLVIDANNLSYRAHSTQQLTTKSGEPVGAIYGTLQMLQSYLKKSEGKWKNKLFEQLSETLKGETPNITDVVMCWDGGKSKWRKAYYPEYKAHREAKRAEKTPEEREAYSALLSQMETLHENLPLLGVRSLKYKGWEGDDLIFAVRDLTPKDEICIIVSTDKDMLQLVDEKTFVWSPFKEILVTPENFFAFTGVSKPSYLTYRVLVGDSSDNIPGIKGIGDKKAKDLIIKYGNIEGIRVNRDSLMKSKVTSRIFDEHHIIDRNVKLMDMRHIPVMGFTIGDVVEDGITQRVSKDLDEKLEFQSGLFKMFLMSKQFVSIISGYATWTQPFAELN